MNLLVSDLFNIHGVAFICSYISTLFTWSRSSDLFFMRCCLDYTRLQKGVNILMKHRQNMITYIHCTKC